MEFHEDLEKTASDVSGEHWGNEESEALWNEEGDDNLEGELEGAF